MSSCVVGSSAIVELFGLSIFCFIRANCTLALSVLTRNEARPLVCEASLMSSRPFTRLST